MLVRDFMTVEPWTIAPERSIKDAKETMLIHRVRRLPVVEMGTLVGIVTKEDVIAASPSILDFTSADEMKAHMEGTTVNSVMAEDPYTVDSDDPLEKAAQIMREKKIGGLPVLQDGKLVGMITETDIFRALVQILGIESGTEREEFEAVDVREAFDRVAKSLEGGEKTLLSMLVFSQGGPKKQVVVRTRPARSSKPRP